MGIEPARTEILALFPVLQRKRRYFIAKNDAMWTCSFGNALYHIEEL